MQLTEKKKKISPVPRKVALKVYWNLSLPKMQISGPQREVNVFVWPGNPDF